MWRHTREGIDELSSEVLAVLNSVVRCCVLYVSSGVAEDGADCHWIPLPSFLDANKGRKCQGCERMRKTHSTGLRVTEIRWSYKDKMRCILAQWMCAECMKDV